MALVLPPKIKSILKNPKWTRDEKWERLRTTRIDGKRPVPSAGAYLQVLVFSTFVIKRWRPERSIEWPPSGFRADVEYVRRMRKSPRTRPFFAKTVHVGSFLIQERVKMDYDLSYNLIGAVEQFGESLGMSDLHEDNVGWRMTKRGPIPVFFDFNLRSESGTPRIRRVSYVKKWLRMYREERGVIYV